MDMSCSSYAKLDAKLCNYVDNVWMLVDMRNTYDIYTYSRRMILWNDIIKYTAMQTDVKRTDIKALY